MADTPHELHEEFPELSDRIHELKVSDNHFLKLFDEYHEVNRAVHSAETDVTPTGDAGLTDMRRQRMNLKDELYSMLTAK